MGIHRKPVDTYYDNNAVISFTKNGINGSKHKHVDMGLQTRYYENHEIIVEFLSQQMGLIPWPRSCV